MLFNMLHAAGNALFVVPPLGGMSCTPVPERRLKAGLRTEYPPPEGGTTNATFARAA
jgi:hypothetical protein